MRNATALRLVRRVQAGEPDVDRPTLAAAVDRIVSWTSAEYTRRARRYAEVRAGGRTSTEEHLDALLLAEVRSRIAAGKLAGRADGRWRLLDAGAGTGRDILRLAREPDVDPVALERSGGFLKILRELEVPAVVLAGDVRAMDMIPDATFHCVRVHAVMHHLPEVGPGLGADSAVAEFRRILVAGGVLYVFTRAGEGIQLIDTGEGLGKRVYQLFTPATLADLLRRHAFTPVHVERLTEDRPSGAIEWIFALAVDGLP